MRAASTITVLSLVVAACGGGDDGPATPDAGVKDIGFTKPTLPLKANSETAPDTWTEIGPANLSCLNTPSADVPSTAAITVTTTVTDFEKDTPVEDTVVTAFAGTAVDSPFGAAATAAATTAEISTVIPAGTTRFGWKMVNREVAFDTLLLNQKLPSASTTPQALETIRSVSTSTAATLPALIRVNRTPGTGIIAGALRDCDDNEVSNFIATVSSTPGTVTFLEGVDTYYFSPSVGLPIDHKTRNAANRDGLFMAIELPPTASAYVQMWGYPTQADVDSDNLVLISELQLPVIADTAVTGSYEPLRN